MLGYIIRRIFIAIPTLLLLSVVSFAIIQAPPGDYLTAYVAMLEESGTVVDPAEVRALRDEFQLDRPIYEQYLKWMGGVVRGDFGRSFRWQRPVSELIWERLGLSMAVALVGLFFAWAIAIPIGIFSAVKQYSFLDYLFTGVGFLGLATPDFMVALLVLWTVFAWTGDVIAGLFSPDFVQAPWSLAKVIDLLKHLWLPALIVGTNATAGSMRVMRANLLDELRRPYVQAARARGVPGWRLVLKYPVRLALNPFVSSVGWVLPGLISSGTIVAIVLSLQTEGPMLLDSFFSQDMFLAGTLVMLLSVLTIIGTLISDILLAWLDPRIRQGER